MPAIGISSRLRFDQSFPALVIAFLCCSVSLVLTINFCRELRGDGAVILVAIGIAWEVAKFHFGPMGLRYLAEGRKTAGLALIILSMVLVSGSFLASLGYLMTTANRAQQQAMVASHSYQDLQHQIDSLDQRIAWLSSAASADVSQHFRTRALSISQEIQTLSTERHTLQEQQMHLEMHSENASLFFTSLGSLLPGDAGQNGTRVRFASHAVVAIMIELIGIAALALLQTPRTSNTSDAVAEQPVDAPPPPEADSRYEQAKALVANGDVSPTLRGLQMAMRASQQTVERYLAEMQDEGMLLRVGRRYKLAA